MLNGKKKSVMSHPATSVECSPFGPLLLSALFLSLCGSLSARSYHVSFVCVAHLRLTALFVARMIKRKSDQKRKQEDKIYIIHDRR